MALIVNNTTITNLNVVQKATGITTNIDVFNESGGDVIFTKSFTLTKSAGAVVTRIGSSVAGNVVSEGVLNNGAVINYGDVLTITPQTIIDNDALFGYFVINGSQYPSSDRSVTIDVTSNVDVVCWYWDIVFPETTVDEFSFKKTGTSYTTKSFNSLFLETRGIELESLFNARYIKFRILIWDKDAFNTEVSSSIYTFDKPTLTSSQERSFLSTTGSTQYVTITGKQYGNFVAPEITFRYRGVNFLLPDPFAVTGILQFIY